MCMTSFTSCHRNWLATWMWLNLWDRTDLTSSHWVSVCRSGWPSSLPKASSKNVKTRRPISTRGRQSFSINNGDTQVKSTAIHREVLPEMDRIQMLKDEQKSVLHRRLFSDENMILLYLQPDSARARRERGLLGYFIWLLGGIFVRLCPYEDINILLNVKYRL